MYVRFPMLMCLFKSEELNVMKVMTWVKQIGHLWAEGSATQGGILISDF